MLRLDMQFARHLVSVVACEVSVKILAIATDRAPDGRGVGDEERVQIGLLQAMIEQSHASDPLIINSYRLTPRQCELWGHSKQCRCRSNGKETGIIVVAIAEVGLDAIVLPHEVVELITDCGKRCVVHEDRLRFAPRRKPVALRDR